MRVVTGIAKGKRLDAPEGKDVRPTPERVKEALFSAIQFDIEGRKILDLFAGSGQLGIEALSRGAESAVFVDNNQVSCRLVEGNLKRTGFEQKAKVVRSDYTSFIATTNESFDIVFLDPPYHTGLLLKSTVAVQSVVSKFGILVCEHPNTDMPPEEIMEFGLIKRYVYGKVCISIYKRKGA